MNNERITYICDVCGREFEGEPREFEGEIMCEGCFADQTFECDICGTRHHMDYSNWVEDNLICDDCYEEETFECHECGGRFLNHHNHGDNDDIPLCEQCRDNYYSRCDCCDSLIRDSDIYWVHGNPYCYSCYEDEMEHEKIHSYDYKPEPIFRGFCPNHRYLGVELEIAGAGENNENAEEILEILNLDNNNESHAYAKHDGSLERGFEIVSHPMTLTYHKEIMPWREAMQKAIKLGYRSHKTTCCGLHVHVSRDSLGNSYEERQLTISKILYFVEKHWAEMFQFSRRDEYTIQRWASPYGFEVHAGDILEKANGRCHDERYHNVNLQNNNTIEFRFFRGTLKYNTFIATLQLVDEIVEVAINYSENELSKLSWSQFVSLLTEPELIQYLKERKLYVNDTVEESEEM